MSSIHFISCGLDKTLSSLNPWDWTLGTTGNANGSQGEHWEDGGDDTVSILHTVPYCGEDFAICVCNTEQNYFPRCFLSLSISNILLSHLVIHLVF